MRDYLFEIYTDEIPSSLVNYGAEKLKENFAEELKNYRLNFREIESFSTSRRFTVLIKNVDEKEEDTFAEIKGPAYSFAYSDKGEPLVPLTKFMQSNETKESEIYTKELKGVKYVFTRKLVRGRSAKEILKAVSEKTTLSLQFPRSMRWDSSNIEFIRPIKNILAMFGSELVDVSIGHLKSTKKTYGFFFDAPFEIELATTEDYMKKLKENYIVLSYQDRKRIVEKRAAEIAGTVSGAPIYTEEFFEEVVNLNEYPVPFLCKLDIHNLNIPDCIIESVLKSHMKSFPIMSTKKKTLLPYFIAVKNGPSDFVEIVREGYERVAKARLLDGLFFYEEDQKVKLASVVSNLSGIVFTKDLGNMLDKTNRLVKLSHIVTEMVSLDEEKSKHLLRAAYLSKADLLTNVQKEFPELQGTIGGIYAKNQGEGEEVSLTISEQYYPRYQGDSLPTSRLGKLLSLVDRVDTLTGSIMSGVLFSSSKDPFGLRRLASGIVQLLNSTETNYFNLSGLIKESTRLFIEFNPKFEDKSAEIISIIKDRALYFLKDNGIRYDVANAVSALTVDLLPSYLKRATVLMKQLDTEKLQSICQSHKRVTNILASVEEIDSEVKKELLFDKSELELYEAIEESEKLFQQLINENDNEAALQMLYLITPIVTSFFDNILVMDKDESVKQNRLALLRRLKSLIENFANFSEIVFDNK